MKIGLLTPTTAFIKFDYDPRTLAIVKAIPGHRKWNANARRWEFKLGLNALTHLTEHLPSVELEPEIADFMERKLAERQQAAQMKETAAGTEIRDYKFKTSGCVDAETEYLSPHGWRRMDQYDGGKVAQWCPETGEAAFVEPLQYHVKPCSFMLHFKTKYGVDQMLSPDHRMPHRSHHNIGPWKDAPAAEVAERHCALPSMFRLHFDGPGLDLSEPELRVQVAAMADGSFPAKNTTYCRVNLKKRRKIERLRALLWAAGIQFNEKERQDGFSVFTFYAPMRCKTYEGWAPKIYEHDAAVIRDEIFHWDGSVSRGSYWSRHEADADFVQTLFSAGGELRPAERRFCCAPLRWQNVLLLCAEQISDISAQRLCVSFGQHREVKSRHRHRRVSVPERQDRLDDRCLPELGKNQLGVRRATGAHAHRLRRHVLGGPAA